MGSERSHSGRTIIKRSEEKTEGEDESTREQGQSPKEHSTSKEGSEKEI